MVGDYITIEEAKKGFKGYYRIGKYYFHSFNRIDLLKDLKGLQESCREITDRLMVIEEEIRRANR